MNLKESTVPKEDYVSLKTRFETEIDARDSEIEYLKERSIPKEDYISLQNQLETEINARKIVNFVI